MSQIDEALQEQWHAEFQGRKWENQEDEFSAQQSIYTKYADKYDDIIHSDCEQYVGFKLLANAINDQFADKNLKILDFGAGTGLLGLDLHNRNYKNIDVSDCNEGLLTVAKERGIFNNIYCSVGAVGLPPQRSYDMICSSGTFFITKSHPSFDIFPELVKRVKVGGYIMLLVKKSYLDKDYVGWDVVNEMLRKNILEEAERVYIPGYRRVFEGEDDKLSMAVILQYKVCQ